jgi:hypothetical protein
MLIPIGRNISDLGTNPGTGIWQMWGRHLKKRGNWWHYYRAVPKRYRDVDARGLISFALRTVDFAQARLQAAQISYDLDLEWEQAVARGVSLSAQNHTIRFGAASAFQQKNGLKPQCATEFSDEEMLRRLRMLLSSPHSTTDQSAILGLINKPEISMFEAFERFWEHIEDEWSALSHDQKRVKRNG